ncbi:response regulator receiver domain-containing protein [Chitinophaga niastensis]|uniref:Response regulator receiver domain-containing protein n=1 Tax=Chitinophaga niastensis TaxID=536980 RepID=A0A2P8HIW0_CHINA|nr:response regulator [Chitinophaga niastensis]PSL46158.1 response regulator receiver domain-containing protein [Chitinophaga niastensis]
MKLINMIFIVDDDPIHQQIAKIMIERQAISSNIRVFSDAQDVLDYLRDNAADMEALPDLILLDLNMPVMDGWEFLEEYAIFCAQLPKAIRIFVLTSSIDEKDKERVGHYSFVTGYLTKPLSKEIIAHLS